MANVCDITSESDYKNLTSSLQPGALVSIFFHTPWAEPCKQMRTFFNALASQYPVSNKLAFLAVDAETLYDISEAFDVTAVPFFVLVRDGVTLQSISGSNSGQVRDAVEKEAGAKANAMPASLPEKLSVTQPAANGTTESRQSNGGIGGGGVTKDLSGYAPAADDPKTGPQYSSGVTDAEAAASSQEDLDARLAGLVKAAPVMLFMKGTPSSPQCGFSRQLVAILRERGVRYGFFNILADEEVRQGLKVFADWPTFPQLWVGGELVGGLDIVKEEVETDPDFFAQYSVGRNNGGMAAPEAQTTPQVTA